MAAKHSELPAVIVPPHLWTRSPRPVHGRIVQVALPGVLIVVGLIMSRTALRVGFVLAGIGLFLLLPNLVHSRLERLGREILAADRKTAEELLRTLRKRPVVQFFAPLAWLSLQEGILQLKIGDGKSAAANFAETARQVRQPDAVMLLSAQAHALVLAGDRTEARELLQRLAKENLIGPRDQLDLGIVLLLETKKSKQALAYVEAARKTLGDHPRVLAAMALALQKTERIDEASELLEQVQILAQGHDIDPVVDDLVKRARKGLQAFIEAQLRRERRSRSRRTTIVVSSDLAASEIVSGEIGAGDQAQLDNPTTGFKPAEPAPSVISARSVDGELTSEERQMLNIPEPRRKDAPAPRAPDSDPDASGPSISFEDSSAHASPPTPAAPPASPVNDTASLFDSMFDALTDAPVPGPGPVTSLINPAVTVPTTATMTPPRVVPVAPPPVEPPAKAPEVDVPVFRRKQTLTAIPVAQDKEKTLERPAAASRSAARRPAAPTTTPSSLPPLTSLPVGNGPKSGLPTRATRHDGNQLPTGGAPRSNTPVFRAPVIGTLKSDKDDDERNR
jgi:tetratricopeptide (TPR) repeat protein